MHRAEPPRTIVQSKEGILMTTPNGDSAGLRRDPVAGIHRDGAATVVALAGELDLYNAEPVREALFGAAADGPERLVVDLSEVQFIDSTALGVLIEARSKLAERNRFILAAPGLETRRALEISGLDRNFVVRESLDEALSASL